VLHVRVIVPPEISPRLLETLLGFVAVHNIVSIPGSARRPDGDLVQFDVAREGANDVIAALRELDLHRCGSIAIERVDTAISDAAERSERLSAGDPSEAVVWEEVEARVRADSAISATYLAMMTLAVMIGAVGVLTDSSVLIVGAMVVGPDYGPLAGLSFHLYRQRYRKAVGALGAVIVGYLVAMVGALFLTLCVRWFGNIPTAYTAGARPLTSFIAKPDGWSVIVGVLAGIAGMLAHLEARSGVLVGVLISVTTIPAASNVAVALGVGSWGEANGAAAQLGLNLVVLVIVGWIVLRLGTVVSRRLGERNGPKRPTKG
jgi:uncharacterized hydrophobic protein (TIGR00271 family)